ncbi:MAG: sugar O-acetyltransferase [Oscillospiraceae bacterium]|nr:sugar O-acetyltransferase [Oscillospiraceae bacterium]
MDNITRRDRGMAYIADQAVYQEMQIARRLTGKFNHADPADFDLLDSLAHQIIKNCGKNMILSQPFYCDYGTHISVGDNFFSNYNCVILDVAQVTIGDNVFFAPNVAVYTAGHTVHPQARNSMYEYGIPVTIGSNVWVGGNVVITPGVTIGNNTVIGAGSVVTHRIPSGVIAVGNPCRVLRKITEEDKKYYYKKQEFDAEAWAAINSSKA